MVEFRSKGKGKRRRVHPITPRKGKRTRFWIRTAVQPHERGALHKQLGIAQDERIPKTLLKTIVKAKAGDTIRNPTSVGRRRYKVTRLMEQRAQFALNVGYGRYPRTKRR